MSIKSLKEIKEVEKKEAIIKLADIAVTRIYEDSFGYRGCETCDYGSSYGIEYDIEFSDGTSFELKISESYESPISEGDMMVFLANNLEEFAKMSKSEFIDFISKPENVLGH